MDNRNDKSIKKNECLEIMKDKKEIVNLLLNNQVQLRDDQQQI